PASYTLRLHDALPICGSRLAAGPSALTATHAFTICGLRAARDCAGRRRPPAPGRGLVVIVSSLLILVTAAVLLTIGMITGNDHLDRKSTRLNSSHVKI